MHGETLLFSFFLIFSGAAVLASIALYTRQPLLVAYIILGAIVGPHGFDYISDETNLLTDIANIGIIFLLFLLGLDMQPSNLIHMFKKTALIGIISAILFAVIGYTIGLFFGFSTQECLIIGSAMMFSSTIIGIKLLPTTVLHHRHTGELVVSLLLLQDLFAILVLILLYGTKDGDFAYQSILIAFLSLPLIIAGAILFVRYILLKLIQRFDRFQEYIFLIAIGWCLGLAEAAHSLGLSREIGAFIAGVTIATSPIAFYIANSLKPLRDFFLILFFFSLGAGFDLTLIDDIIIPAAALALLILALKPVIFRYLLGVSNEDKKSSWEIGFRLGQISEFSLLIAYIAFSAHLISNEVSHVIQATAILTFLFSTYIVVLFFPTPIAISDRLRRD